MARPQKDLLMRIIRGHLSGLGEMVGRCVVSRISDQTAWKRPVESTNCKKNQEFEDLAKLEFRLVQGRIIRSRELNGMRCPGDAKTRQNKERRYSTRNLIPRLTH